MSNCPPPPTFGTPFKPNGHMEPLVGSYEHSLPQYPYPYQNASSLYGQGQTNSMPIVPRTNANTHSFHSNAQGVKIPSSGNDVNGAPYAPYGAQIQYSAFQSPAFPPTPFAHGQPSTNSNLPSHSSTAFSDLNVAAEVQSTNVGLSGTVPPVLSELEDGELDDGEVEKPASHSAVSTTTSSGLSQHKWHENEDFADRESGHRVTNAPNAPKQPLPGLIQGITLSLNAVNISEFGF